MVLHKKLTKNWILRGLKLRRFIKNQINPSTVSTIPSTIFSTLLSKEDYEGLMLKRLSMRSVFMVFVSAFSRLSEYVIIIDRVPIRSRLDISLLRPD